MKPVKAIQQAIDWLGQYCEDGDAQRELCDTIHGNEREGITGVVEIIANLKSAIAEIKREGVYRDAYKNVSLRLEATKANLAEAWTLGSNHILPTMPVLTRWFKTLNWRGE